MELNREQIIKALECCTINKSCDGCPIFKEADYCIDILAPAVLSYGKKLTEENAKLTERLKREAKCQYDLATKIVDLKEDNERLRAIALQFTDIVHKWGNKYGYDTSEISLVPILNEGIEYKNQVKADTVRKMQDKVIPIIESLVELMWDDNEANCIVESCNKPDIIGCGNRICIDENKALWIAKIDQIAKEMVEEMKC